MIDFDAVFFIRLQKRTKVTWATKFFEKNKKRGHLKRKTYFYADVIEISKNSREQNEYIKRTFCCADVREIIKNIFLRALLAMCSFTQKKRRTYGVIIIIKVRPLKSDCTRLAAMPLAVRVHGCLCIC